MGETAPFNDSLLEELYGWIDQVPLSRPKRDVKRDFSDGVLTAEVVKHFLPKLVEIHNYAPASKLDKKITNWRLLNRKVFKKLGFELADDVINNVSLCKPWAIEQVLMLLQRKIDRFVYEKRRTSSETTQITETPSVTNSDKPEADQTQQVKKHETQTPAINTKSNVIPLGPQRVKNHGDMVPKLHIEEKEQEILAKDETIQILQAKVRRLEHLLHLKDIRIDDLQGRLERMEAQLRPTGVHNPNK